MTTMTPRERIELCILAFLADKSASLAEIQRAVAADPFCEGCADRVGDMAKAMHDEGAIEQPVPCDAVRLQLTIRGRSRHEELRTKALYAAVESQPPAASDDRNAASSRSCGAVGVPIHINACPGSEAEMAKRLMREPGFAEAIRSAIREADRQLDGVADRCADEDEDVDESHVMYCLTERALDAWWNSLPMETKAEVMMNHYETVAMCSDRILVTDAGRPALAAHYVSEAASNPKGGRA